MHEYNLHTSWLYGGGRHQLARPYKRLYGANRCRRTRDPAYSAIGVVPFTPSPSPAASAPRRLALSPNALLMATALQFTAPPCRNAGAPRFRALPANDAPGRPLLFRFPRTFLDAQPDGVLALSTPVLSPRRVKHFTSHRASLGVPELVFV